MTVETKKNAGRQTSQIQFSFFDSVCVLMARLDHLCIQLHHFQILIFTTGFRIYVILMKIVKTIQVLSTRFRNFCTLYTEALVCPGLTETLIY